MSSPARLLLVLGLILAVGAVFLLGGGGEDDPAPTPDPSRDHAPEPKPEPMTPPAPVGPSPVEPPVVPSPLVEPPDVTVQPRKPAGLPLSDVIVPDVDWKEHDGVRALYDIAAQAGMNLSWRGAAKIQMEKVKVTLKLESSTAAHAFDMLTQPYGLYWTIRGGEVEIYVDDAD